MKRVTLLSIAVAVLLVPAFASAEALKFVYRRELRQWIAVPAPVEGAAVATLTPQEKAARHEAMAHAYRGGRQAQAADHCDRMMKQAREAARKAS
jgi:hypothetical protein